MTLSELINFDGQNGKPAYVAVSGIIYDVSSSKHWQQGNHEGAHQAGQDLTEELKTAPHVRSVIERFPVVGQLTSAETARQPGRKLPVVAVVAGVVVVLLLVLMLLR
ncbi:cytochrome b5 domain-containing protein [Pelovirga terrestris]|uniref:Cytochrome B5 n=1 Tax=Pelovirga terrestris TaxID=2771352 RepID=A0A8J6UR13_9BACT|nr:cytochrome b5 domain-containing protein [Pelovirga terrestris]MBD1400261.1 cytochrome B5 [Pelovirga terrestris]